jgi:hypothetical protein
LNERNGGFPPGLARTILSNTESTPTVSPQGETKVETKGFTGNGCREASRALEAALGLRTSETLTAEFYHATQQEAGLVAQPDARS